MKKNRRKHNPSFKARVAMEAMKGEETMPGISTIALPSREHDTWPVSKRLTSKS